MPDDLVAVAGVECCAFTWATYAVGAGETNVASECDLVGLM